MDLSFSLSKALIFLLSEKLEGWTEVFLSISCIAHHSVHLKIEMDWNYSQLNFNKILGVPPIQVVWPPWSLWRHLEQDQDPETWFLLLSFSDRVQPWSWELSQTLHDTRCWREHCPGHQDRGYRCQHSSTLLKSLVYLSSSKRHPNLPVADPIMEANNLGSSPSLGSINIWGVRTKCLLNAEIHGLRGANHGDRQQQVVADLHRPPSADAPTMGDLLLAYYYTMQLFDTLAPMFLRRISAAAKVSSDSAPT